MAAILQMTFSNVISSMEMFLFSIKIFLKFAPKGPIGN